MSKSRLLTLLAAAMVLSVPALDANAQAPGKLKVGFMLPYTGTFAALGTAIENGFRLYVNEQGGKLGGREIEYVKVDDESEPSKGADNVNKLIKRDNVDVVVGTVHSGVAMAMAKVAKESGTLLIVPNAGAQAVTERCVAKHLPLVFPDLAAGLWDGRSRGREGVQESRHHHGKYAAGDESVGGSRKASRKVADRW